MNKESLKKARDLIIKTLYFSTINAQDKTELMMNISSLLNESTYEKQIKVLRKEKFKK